eukprot:3863675-Rhodomonas_salina.2
MLQDLAKDASKLGDNIRDTTTQWSKDFQKTWCVRLSRKTAQLAEFQCNDARCLSGRCFARRQGTPIAPRHPLLNDSFGSCQAQDRKSCPRRCHRHQHRQRRPWRENGRSAHCSFHASDPATPMLFPTTAFSSPPRPRIFPILPSS